MKHPLVIVCGFDDWLAKQLAPLAADSGWLVADLRQPAAALSHAREPRPTVLVVQADPADSAGPLRLVSQAHAAVPDAAVVVVCDAKIPDADRPAWTAAAFDLGAKFVLFPPLTRPVLEDLVGGLMAAVIRRTTPPAAAGVIDLAEEGRADP